MIIAGLGNPGSEYEFTRHNAGFWAMDVLAKKFRTEFKTDKHNSLTCNFNFRGQTHLMIKPLTFMNLSADAIAPHMRKEDILPKELIVIADDISLPIGKIRLRQSGSDGGHNGLKSIISHIGQNFWRLRIGVGQPIKAEASQHRQIVSHVLGKISSEEGQIFANILEDIPDLVRMLLLGMGSKAMSKYNSMDYSPATEEILKPKKYTD